MDLFAERDIERRLHRLETLVLLIMEHLGTGGLVPEHEAIYTANAYSLIDETTLASPEPKSERPQTSAL